MRVFGKQGSWLASQGYVIVKAISTLVVFILLRSDWSPLHLHALLIIGINSGMFSPGMECAITSYFT